MKAREIMTQAVISINEAATVEDAARLLARNRISGLPVVNAEGLLVGLVSEHDLIAKPGRLVGELMTRGVITIGLDTEVEQIQHLLTHQRIRRVPVVEHGKVVGIVSRSDLVRQIAMRWVCGVCGESVRGLEAPSACPSCGAGTSAFVHDVVPPGM
ncbi:CBS domain-containing protein [Candidatus Viridilinea mediisalina]|uniref:Signal transduction protein n=1 Tax=Candidatus Viridilinea mediisalina TaxID=2024553 RepID=A0A2A6RE80_9CHLR|nr:CBS domain-containing protein [Candidatus Viridilinea mediisalina]PDW00537.1 signal transduction protein [Candidatus Viridilinea mediisalina]